MSWHNPYANATLFVVVRNPFDRLISVISEYFYQMDDMVHKPEQYLSDPKNLNAWIKYRLPALNAIPNKLRGPIHAGTNTTFLGESKYFLDVGHLIPQYDYVFDHEGQRIIEPVLQFDNLAAEFATLMGQYGLGNVVRLPTKDNGTGRDSNCRGLSVANLTLDNIQMNESCYAHDFEAFGFATMSPSLAEQKASQ